MDPHLVSLDQLMARRLLIDRTCCVSSCKGSQCNSSIHVKLQNTDLSNSITTVLLFASCHHNLVRAQTGMANGDDVMGRINSI